MIRLLSLLSIILLSITSVYAEDSKISSMPDHNLQQFIKNYLLSNPDIMAEAMVKAQKYMLKQETQMRQQNLIKNKKALINDSRDYVMGIKDAPITIVEFFDYNCGYCKRILPALTQMVKNNPDIRIILKEYPILGKLSSQTAQIVLATKTTGQYLSIHRALLSSRGPLTLQTLDQILKNHGLHPHKIKQEAKSRHIAQHLKDNQKLALKLGITGTPALIIGDMLYPGALAYEQIQSIIDTIRRERKS